jgi:hypothetical protein
MRRICDPIQAVAIRPSRLWAGSLALLRERPSTGSRPFRLSSTSPAERQRQPASRPARRRSIAASARIGSQQPLPPRPGSPSPSKQQALKPPTAASTKSAKDRRWPRCRIISPSNVELCLSIFFLEVTVYLHQTCNNKVVHSTFRIFLNKASSVIAQIM